MEQGMRNEVEGRFGKGKNGYNLSRIRARAARTSESRIAAIFFVMNLVKFSKNFLFSFLRAVFASGFPMQNNFVQQRIRNIAFKL
jgi:transposase, IS5 family